MSLCSEPIGGIPAETARVARAAFPKGAVVMRLRDEFGALYEDEDFRSLYPARGQPGLTPWRLALVTVVQFLEHLSDRPTFEARPRCAPAQRPQVWCQLSFPQRTIGVMLRTTRVRASV